MEPEVTNKVSYLSVSAEILTRASGEVIKESFLQEQRKSNKDIVSIPRVFIDTKNNNKEPE